MDKGDIVYLWMSGDGAGIYAQAILTEAPSKRLMLPYDEKFIKKPESPVEGNYVLLEIQRRFLDCPLSKSELKKYEILKDLQIITVPQGTNFKVSAESRPLIEDILRSLA